MKLKRVKIVGFKTFADRTDISVEGNIIAVVGPNGCGKSNIVDAILWGLGETNARSLRAQTAAEVIFNGSQRRKPLGYAEVTLTFDNEDGALPLESAEVAITRRMSRSGESDYFINKRACRLRDITELLADSGLGRTGYAIVGQSDIDQALAASAGQRRAWIDEAAGVQRYRLRRQETIKRLDACAANMARVQDIIREIDTQREPLSADAELARRFKVAQAALRDIELGLLVHEYAEADGEVTESESRSATTQKLIAEFEARLTEADELSILAAEEAATLEIEANRLRGLEMGAQRHLDQTITQKEVAEAKLTSLDALESNLTTAESDSKARIAQLKADAEEAATEMAAVQTARDELRSQVAGTNGVTEKLARELKETDRLLQSARQALESQRRHEIEAEHRNARLHQVKRELEGIDGSVKPLQDGVAEAEEQLNGILAQVGTAEQAIADIDTEFGKTRKLEDQEQATQRELLTELAALDGRRRAIEATVAAHEGLTQGTRNVLHAAKEGQLPAAYISIADAIEVDPDLALAVETALGSSVNDLIVPNEGVAKEAIEYLKRGRLGRATFQPLSLMRRTQTTRELQDVLANKAVVGLASELVRCSDEHRAVLDSLLGRIVVVEDLDSALRLAKTGGWARMVTLDGEVVFSSGAVTGGVGAKQTAGAVQRKADLIDIERDAVSLQSVIEGSRKATSDLIGKCDALHQQRGEIKAKRDELRRDAEDTRVWLASLKQELNAALRTKEKLDHELAKLGVVVEPVEANANVDEVETRRDELVRALASCTTDAEQSSTRLKEVDGRVETARQRLAELERRFKLAEEADRNQARQVANIGPERERLTVTIEGCVKEIAVFSEKVKQLQSDIERVSTARGTAFEKERAAQAGGKEYRDTVKSLGEQLHKTELSRARAEGKRSAAHERLLEEYGMNPDEAAEICAEQDLPEDAHSLVSKLRRQLKDMGEVNLGAIEAFERLTERYEELTNQLDDVASGKADLESSLRELDRLTRDKFVETFKLIQAAFVETFKSIFGDGEASLELTDTENVLDSGVEISVQIPGKRRQRLELLSGGERALAASAFLFALIKVKPTPLVILDEIDAPLDGRNVERFIATMRGFSDTIQFILITHNPVTIESADVWFGVTMQEPGVSTLVPVRIPDKSIVKAVVPDAYLKG